MGIDHHHFTTPTLPVAHNISEKKARVMPAVGIYRPPAARRLDAQQNPPSSIAAEKPRSKQRRPDIQVYVPRPKRSSTGVPLTVSQESSPTISSEAKATRRHSSSLASTTPLDVSKTPRLVLDSQKDSSLCRDSHAVTLNEEDCNKVVPRLVSSEDKDNLIENNCSQFNLVPAIDEGSQVLPGNLSSTQIPSNNCTDLIAILMEESPPANCRREIPPDHEQESACNQQSMDRVTDQLLELDDSVVDFRKNSASATTSADVEDTSLKTVSEQELLLEETEEKQDLKNGSENIRPEYGDCFKVTPVESEKSDRKTIENLCLVEILAKERVEKCEDEEDVCRNREDQNRKNRSIHRGNISYISDLLVISDSESSQMLPPSAETNSTDHLEKHPKVKLTECEETKTVQSNAVRLNPDECTWDMMFDENGDCLDPLLMEELTSKVGEVTIKTPQSDYKQFVTREALPRDEYSHVIEIYNFPAEFKTQDLITVFSAYRSRGFEIKWVDDTHALGVFSSSVVAEEVLETNHPFLKTRPLHEATPESRAKARRSSAFLQPYRARPETCPALARRMVTGALGVRLSTAKQEREAEKALLKVARDKKKLEARQKDEAWEGTLSGTLQTTD